MKSPSSAPPLVVSATEQVNLDYHHGALRPAVGVHTWQVMRANRDRFAEGDPTGWTYNHAPMLAWWNGRFFLEYLSNPVAEHVAPGRTLLTTSEDGRRWTPPQVVFPEFRIPWDGNPQLRETHGGTPEFAIMHQRMGFHVAPNGRLLILGFYGFSQGADQLPFDQRGIGRVVREIHPDGSWGGIHYLRLNRQAGWNEVNAGFPFYRQASDPGFVAACDSLLADALAVQQWQEEHGDADELIRLKGSRKALSYYTLPDGRAVGLWKWQKAGITSDRGHSWDWVGIAPTVANAGGKIWGQRTSDGRFALVYNPSTNNKHRWPLAVVTSDDGLNFKDMLLVNGEVAPRRYGGCKYKNCGQNYVRGICERGGVAPDGALWVAYSMNKEDIWISRVPVPVTGSVDGPVDDHFDRMKPGSVTPGWNLYSPLWAPVEVATAAGGEGRSLRLTDSDPHDHAIAERVFRRGRDVTVEIRVMAEKIAGKPLFIELWDGAGQIPVRLVFTTNGVMNLWHGRGVEKLGLVEPGRWYRISLHFMADRKSFEVSVDGENRGKNQQYQGEEQGGAGWYLRMPAETVERLVFRTGPPRRSPTVEHTTVDLGDLSNAAERLAPSIYHIGAVRIP